MMRTFASPLPLMIGGSAASCAAIAVASPGLMPELALGMAGPLTSAVASWHVMERTQAAAPERLTGVLMAGFAVKAALFALYIIVMLGVLAMRPKPLVASFTGYYVALHIVEAILLRRRLSGGRPEERASRPE